MLYRIIYDLTSEDPMKYIEGRFRKIPIYGYKQRKVQVNQILEF
jgi:hypothetical protein